MREVLFLLTICILTSAQATATDWMVPGDFDTVDAAIAAAQNGDSILIGPGTHASALMIDKDLDLVGDPAAPQDVILQLESFAVSAPQLASLSGFTLSGQVCQTDAFVTGNFQMTDCLIQNFGPDVGQRFVLMFAEVEFVRCTFQDNSSGSSIVWIVQRCSALFEECRFLENSGGVAGAIMMFGTSDVLVRHSLFRGNHTSFEGGAIHGGSGLVVEGCLFENNSADRAGGALHGSGTQPCLVKDSTFRSNSAANGGALATDQIFNFHLENTDFENNSATESGPQGWTDIGGDIEMVCCMADLSLWGGTGQVTLDNEGCTVGTRTLTWDQVKARYR